MKSNKRGQILFSAFITIFIFITVFPIVVYAREYSGIVSGVAEHIKMRTGFQNVIREAGFSLLQFLATFIDMIYNSINDIAKFNLYDIIQNNSGISRDSLVMPMAWSILSIVIIFIALRLILKSDTKINEDGLKFMLCLFLIIVFPAFVSACGDLRVALVDDVKDVEVTDKDGTLGEQILASYVIDIDASVNNAEVVYLNDKRSQGSISDADISNINSVFPNWEGHNNEYVDTMFEVKVVEDPTEWNGIVSRGSYDFDYIIDSLGVSLMYQTYLNAKQNNELIRILTSVSYENGYQANYTEYSADDYADKIMLPQAINNNNNSANTIIPSDLGVQISNYTTWSDFSIALRTAIRNYVTSLKVFHEATPIEGTSLYIADLYDDLHLENLLSETLSIDNIGPVLGNYFAYLIRSIKTTGYPAENIYKYDFEFLFCLITLIATLVSLIFATLKLAKMLYELVFLEIISPIFIAIDSGTWQGQKTKQVVNNFVTTSAMFAIVILVLKLYLAVILNLFQQTDMNFILRLVFILAGAAFVIDGPDSVVKILGMDAGVKSGYGALRGVQAGIRTVSGAARTTSRAAKFAGSAPSSAASAIGQHRVNRDNVRNAKKQASEMGKGFIGRSIAANKARLSNSSIGSAYKKSYADKARANDDYSRYTSPDIPNDISNPYNGSGSISNANNSNESVSTVHNNGEALSNSYNSDNAAPISADTAVSNNTSTSSPAASQNNTSFGATGRAFKNIPNSPNTSRANNVTYPTSTYHSNGNDKGRSREYVPSSADKSKIYSDSSRMYYDREKFNPFEGNEYFDSSKEE